MVVRILGVLVTLPGFWRVAIVVRGEACKQDVVKTC